MELAECCQVPCWWNKGVEPCWGKILLSSEDNTNNKYVWVHECQGHLGKHAGKSFYTVELRGRAYLWLNRKNSL